MARIQFPRTKAEIEYAENKGLTEVTAHYLKRKPTSRMAPFTPEWMLRLHKEIFRGAWPYAGRIRKSPPNYGVPTERVRPELMQLADDAHFWSHDPIEAPADLHRRGAGIHPFQDGNGRWVRLLSNIWLRKKTDQIVLWPPGVRQAGAPFREEYLDAIKAAVEGLDPEPLVAIHRRLLARL